MAKSKRVTKAIIEAAYAEAWRLGNSPWAVSDVEVVQHKGKRYIHFKLGKCIPLAGLQQPA